MMHRPRGFRSKGLATDIAAMGFLPSVQSGVQLECDGLLEPFSALSTDVFPLPRVLLHVSIVGTRIAHKLVAELALKCFTLLLMLRQVDLHVG